MDETYYFQVRFLNLYAQREKGRKNYWSKCRFEVQHCQTYHITHVYFNHNESSTTQHITAKTNKTHIRSKSHYALQQLTSNGSLEIVKSAKLSKMTLFALS